MSEKIDAIVINAADNVAVAITEICANTNSAIKGDGFEDICLVLNDIPFGHKIALVDLDLGNSVYKYGAVIGVATKKICRGERVDHSNIAGLRGKL
ncbi:UxaA family hydrolase [Ruminococcaceae bacterium OttesenSCG-928-I18]|nr:UxaA family hydrolase [Ruminococcaceae bacterium OttesenSCG-928-I18]